MIKIIIGFVIMFGLGFAYGRDKELWEKTKKVIKLIIQKLREVIEKIRNR